MPGEDESEVTTKATYCLSKKLIGKSIIFTSASCGSKYFFKSFQSVLSTEVFFNKLLLLIKDTCFRFKAISSVCN